MDHLLRQAWSSTLRNKRHLNLKYHDEEEQDVKVLVTKVLIIKSYGCQKVLVMKSSSCQKVMVIKKLRWSKVPDFRLSEISVIKVPAI